MNTSRRTPPPPATAHDRPVAAGVAKAVSKALSADDNGLGPLGEETIEQLLDEADQDEARTRRIMKFTTPWRDFIRRQDTGRLAAIDEMIDDHLERKALRKFWLRIWRLAIFIVPVVFGWASGFFDKVWPLIQKILKLLQAQPT
jgi:hypothetical protein